MFLSKSGIIKSSVRSVPKVSSVENNKKDNKPKRDNYKINPKSIIPKKVDAKNKQSNWIDKFIYKTVASGIKAKPLTYEKNKKNDVYSNKNIKEQKSNLLKFYYQNLYIIKNICKLIDMVQYKELIKMVLLVIFKKLMKILSNSIVKKINTKVQWFLTM